MCSVSGRATRRLVCKHEERLMRRGEMQLEGADEWGSGGFLGQAYTVGDWAS